MQKRLLLSVFLIACIGLGIGLASAFTGHDEALQAQPAYALEEPAPAEVSAERAEDSQTPEDPLPTSTVAAATPLDVLDGINDTFAAHLRSGWLHVHAEKTFPPEADNGILPNGKPIPEAQIQDTWYHLDEHGTVVEVVSVMRAASGEVVQAGVLAPNGVRWNSATGETDSWEPFQLDALNYGFSWTLRQASRNTAADVRIEEHVPLQQGGSGIEFVVTETFEEPVVADGKKPVTQIETRALFDAETGWLLTKDTVLHFQDGGTEISPHLALAYAYELPPEDVLDYLQKVAGEGAEK